MLYELLLTLYIVNCMFLVLLVLMQKGKSGMGLGGLGGGAQMIFGGSGGQDIFQKMTWILGTIFMSGALFLALIRSSEYKKFQYINPSKTVQTDIQQ